MRLTYAPNQFGRLRMKSRYAVLLGMAIFTGLILSQKAIAGNDGRSSNGYHGGQNGIPLLAGQFSSTLQGSLAICLNPTSFALESCSTSGALVAPLSVLAAGAYTQDNAGNSCAAYTEVDSDLPVNASPPTVTANEHVSAKVVNYDPTTGIGDGSFTAYAGGACNGSTLDSTGATELSTGTDHFVISKDGNRGDYIFTSLTNSTGSIGDFSLAGTDLKQTR
jgi:hypothetical protein